jgi:hypothetical protein
MATRTHKKRIKTEPCDYFEFGFFLHLPGETDPCVGPEKTFYFVPLVPLCDHANCGI